MAEQKIPLEQLKVGHYIKLPVGWTDHPFLLSNFLIKTQDQLSIIQHLGMPEVTIDPSKSRIGTPASKSKEDKEEKATKKEVIIDEATLAQKEMRSAMRRSEKAFSESMGQFKDSLGQLNLQPDEGLELATELVRSTAQKLMQHPKDTIPMNLIRTNPTQDLLLTHSLNIALMCMQLAKEMDWSAERVEEAGLAGLVHDIGKLKIPNQITYKKMELTKSERNFLEMHPQYGKEMLDKLNAFTPAVREAVFHHHERLDGSGYPERLKGSQITELARMVGVIDFYDEVMHQPIVEKRKQPNQAIAMLYKMADKQFDGAIIGLLVKILGVYPPGTLVKLSNGAIAIVLSTQPNHPLKPKVHPYEKGKRSEAVELLDLMNSEITISGATKPEDIPDEAGEFFRHSERFSYFFDFSH